MRTPQSAQGPLSSVDQRGVAVAALARQYKMPLVPYQQVFDAACKLAPADHWSWDDIHPTYAGHYLMATAWMRTIQEYDKGRPGD